jgi:DNA-binding PadR family transcriptional regulator
VRLTAGTLYGALNRLADDGLVAQSREDIVEGRRRRYYRLTAAGQAALGAETARLQSVAAALGSRSGVRPTRKPRLA